MRYAVKDRPVEPFDTDLKLPEWQLEPDDEHMQGDPQDYYFIDENGNLVPPPGSDQQGGGNAYPPDATEPDRRGQPGYQDNDVPDGPAQPAANDDFLDRATGRSGPRDQGPRRQMPPPQPRNYPAPPQRGYPPPRPYPYGQ